MATFWEIAARSVSNLFSLYFFLFVIFIYFPFGFKRICLLLAQVPFLCFSITSITFGDIILLWHCIGLFRGRIHVYVCIHEGEKVNLGAADNFLYMITKLIKSGAICL